jgi:hypothetical protein
MAKERSIDEKLDDIAIRAEKLSVASEHSTVEPLHQPTLDSRQEIAELKSRLDRILVQDR